MNTSAKNLIFILLAFSALAHAQVNTQEQSSQSNKWNTAKLVAQCTGAAVTVAGAAIGLVALIKYNSRSNLQTLLLRNRMQYAQVQNDINNNDQPLTPVQIRDIAHTLEPLSWEGYHLVQTVDQINNKINTMQNVIFESQNASPFSLSAKLSDAMIQELNESIRHLTQIRGALIHTNEYTQELTNYRQDLRTHRQEMNLQMQQFMQRQHERDLRRDDLRILQTTASLQHPSNTIIVNGGK